MKQIFVELVMLLLCYALSIILISTDNFFGIFSGSMLSVLTFIASFGLFNKKE